MAEYFGPLEDVAFGIGDAFSYDQFKLWIERQQLNFSKSLSFSGTLTAFGDDGTKAEITSGETRWYSGLAAELYPAYARARTLADGSDPGEYYGFLDLVAIEFDDGLVSPGLSLRTHTADSTLWQASLKASAFVYIQIDATGQIDFVPGVTGQFRMTNTEFGGLGGNGSGIMVPQEGDATTPAFSFLGDTDTGIYRKSANLIGFSAGGTEKVTIGANGIKLIDGSAASPAYSFIGDTNTGMYRSAADRIGFAAGGVEKVTIGANRLSVQNIFNLGSVGSTLVIASGGISPTASFHRVDTEGSASTDDLVGINTGSQGDILILRTVTGSRVVTAKDGVSNLLLAGDFVMNSVQDTLTLFCVGGSWLELCRSNNA